MTHQVIIIGNQKNDDGEYHCDIYKTKHAFTTYLKLPFNRIYKLDEKGKKTIVNNIVEKILHDKGFTEIMVTNVSFFVRHKMRPWGEVTMQHNKLLDDDL